MKTFLKNISVFTLIIISLITCKRDELGDIGFPRIRTLVVEMISDTGAVFKGEIIDLPEKCEIIDHGFVWTEYKNSTSLLEKISLGKINVKGNFQATANRAMAEGKKYYFKAFVQTTTTTIFGNEIF